MTILKRVETATGHHPWVKLVTGAVLLAGMMAPRQTKAQAAPKANPVLAHGDEGCHSNHLRDCSIADLKTLIEKGNDMTKANAAVVLARHGDVTNLPYLLQRLNKEVENGAADPVSGLRNAVIDLANQPGAQDASGPLMATLVKALRRRDDEKNPPANPPALNEIIGYVGEAVNNVPHNCAAIGVGLTAANLANASENARLAGDINAALDPFTPLANDESCKRIMIKLGQP